jgi:hypothetical protein
MGKYLGKDVLKKYGIKIKNGLFTRNYNDVMDDFVTVYDKMTDEERGLVIDYLYKIKKS